MCTSFLCKSLIGRVKVGSVVVVGTWIRWYKQCVTGTGFWRDQSRDCCCGCGCGPPVVSSCGFCKIPVGMTNTLFCRMRYEKKKLL